MKKTLLVIVLLIFAWFLTPVTYALSEDTLSTVLGVDLTSSLFSGASAALTTVASFLVMFRKTKKQVQTLDADTRTFLNNLKDKLEKVANGEMKIEDFIAEMTGIVGNMQTVFTNAITDLKAENSLMKDEIALVKEQFPVFIQLAGDIKTAEKNLEAMIRIGFGNNAELVKNGYAKQILMVGQVTDNENQG